MAYILLFRIERVPTERHTEELNYIAWPVMLSLHLIYMKTCISQRY